jgi:signal transduction histidine kinase
VWYVLSIDVTERTVSEEALAKVRSELAHVSRVSSLAALTASIAHEISQPLFGIVANTDTCLNRLAAEPPNVAGAEEATRRTARDVKRAVNIVKRLRALFAKRHPTRELVDLNDATREVMALSWGDLQRKRVVVCLELAEKLPKITGDRVQIQQVILNLLMNAANAMRGIEASLRQATVRTERATMTSVRLSVRDTGVGIAAQVAERLFDAFFTTKTEGMGIGLSISRTIIESHSGQIWAEANDGPGATIAFSIPCDPQDLPAVQAATLGPQRSGDEVRT